MIADTEQTVLLVDGEPLILNLCRTVLQTYGFKVLCSTNGRTGLQLFRQNADTVRLVVSDLQMNDLSGPDMANQMISQNPALKVLYMSAYGADRALPVGQSPVLHILTKPFTSEQFLRTVQSTLASA